MLSVGRLGPSGGAYYCSAVAAGAEDYYVGAGEAPGRWWGCGLAGAGLQAGGRVQDGEFLAVLAGRHPKTGVQLVPNVDGRVPGLDLTFSAPKSVSLLWALHPDESVRLAVAAAHELAVADAVRFLESDALRARRGRGGLERVRVAGLVAAGFPHRTSRSGDPQLHTHLVAANLVQDSSGRWSAMDTRAVYRHARSAGHIYQARLRHELTATLGVGWGPVRSGQADLVGIGRQAIEAFSARRAQIVEALAERGLSSLAAARIAALDTRPAKALLDSVGLFERWQHQAANLDLDVTGLARPGRQPALPPGAIYRACGADGLTANRSSFDRRDIMIALAGAHGEGATLGALEALAGELTRRAGVVELTADGMDSPFRRWTTVDLLATEADLLRLAERATTRHAAVADHLSVGQAIADRPQLNADQRRLVEGICTNPSGIICVIGKAGAGKTFSLDAARAAWQAEGITVVGGALSARASAELQAGSGIPSSTVASLLAGWEEPRNRPPGGSVVVIDEAGMVGTRDLYRLARNAASNRWKLVLVGDPRQLPEISAGGSFAALCEKAPAWTLAANIRQVEAWERAALDQLRDRQARPAMAAWISRGRVTLAETAGELRQNMVADWHRIRSERHSVVMLAVRRADVEQLNSAAQHARVAAGELDAASAVEIAGRRFMAGDDILCTRNDRRAGLTNGTRLTVRSIDPETQQLIAVDGTGKPVDIPWSYATAGHVQLSYSTTVHKAQGATYDHALLLGDDRLFAEAGYVGLSRGRQANRLYIVAPTLATGYTALDPHPDVDRLITALGASRAQRLSTGDAKADPNLADRPLKDLLAERDRLAEQLAASMPADPGRQLSLIAETKAAIEQAPPGAEWTATARQQVEKDAAKAAHLARQRVEWAAEHRRHGEHLARLSATIDDRVQDLAATMAVDPPAGIVEVLGAHPEHPTERDRWTHTALRVAVWCEVSGQTPQQLATERHGRDRNGPAGHPERTLWAQAVDALDRHHLEHEREKGLFL